MAGELDRAIAELRSEIEGRGGGKGDGEPKGRTPEVFEDAARVVATEIRRMHDMSSDIDRELDKLRWRGESATYFRRHARNQRVRVGQHIEVMESLRVLLLRAADLARQARGKAGVA
jgi:uncharacterized protein YukE